jgi:2,3-bisphosphoglycerate-independent phosphoglycerate mutase
MKHPHVLVILDGFGYRHSPENNAIYQAHPDHFLKWLTQYPHTTLKASGTSVGLLPDMIGNSEVGHLTIGSGRVIKQAVSRIHTMIEDGSFFSNPLLTAKLKEIAGTKKRLHLMGLLSDAGVHSHIEHLCALIKMAGQLGVTNIYVHPFLDGRDVPPQSAAVYLEQTEKALKQIKQGKFGTIHGRFYAMDRDNHWDRTERSYKVLTTPQRPQFSTWQQALADSYDKSITDEFFVPVTMDPHGYIQPGDSLIFFNFRADRARQLTRALIEPDFSKFTTHPLHLNSFITFISYHPDFKVDVLLHKDMVNNTLFDVLSAAHKQIFAIAETEKYAHVTYFFNGGREVIHPNETRILIPSKRHYATYAQIPQMSAPEITHAVLQALQENSHNFYLINYANADMVGHSGDFFATVKAIQVLDYELERLYTRVVDQLGGTLYITADHGKAEEMWNIQLGQPRTAHTLNKVPFLYINKKFYGAPQELPLEELSDIAPFILKNLELPIPPEMVKI